MPFKCAKPECRKCISVGTGSVMQSSKLPLSHWAIAYYLIRELCTCLPEQEGVKHELPTANSPS